MSIRACLKYLCSLAIVSLTACSPSIEVPEPTVEGEFLIHIVRNDGETVKRLAEWYTGSAKNAASIKDANKPIGSDILKVGRKVKIPLGLVVKTEPPTKAKPTPTPSKLVVITQTTPSPEQQEISDTEAAATASEVESSVPLEKFEEEVGPPAKAGASTQDIDSLVSPPSPIESPVLDNAAATPVAAIPSVADSNATSTEVDSFVDNVDELLQKEQAELDALQKELFGGAPGTTATAPKK